VAVLVYVAMRRQWREGLVAVGIALTGIVGWLSFQYASFGDDLSFIKEQSYYYKSTEFPFLATFQALGQVFSFSVTGAFRHNNLLIFQIETLASVLAIGVFVYFIVDVCRGARRRFPVWLSALVLYQVVIASTLVRVFPPSASELEVGQSRTLDVPLSEIRWLFTSVGLFIVAALVVQRIPRLRSPLLATSAGSAIFLQSLFVSGWRFF